MGHIQIYCDSFLKLTLTCMHFSVSSKGARTTKADITAHMYSSLFPKSAHHFCVLKLAFNPLSGDGGSILVG